MASFHDKSPFVEMAENRKSRRAPFEDDINRMVGDRITPPEIRTE
jgi:hypothetical protein